MSVKKPSLMLIDIKKMLIKAIKSLDRKLHFGYKNRLLIENFGSYPICVGELE